MNTVVHPSSASLSGSKLDNRRMLAALIDLAVVGAGGAAILVAAGVLGGDGVSLGAPLAAVVVGWALYYYFACESGGGQTLGKRVMGLRVVRVDGQEAGMDAVALRTVLRVVDTALVGLVAMLGTGERRARLGDLAAGTMIVSTEAAPAAMVPAAAAAAPAVPEMRPFDPVADAETEADEAAPTVEVTPEPAVEDAVAEVTPEPAAEPDAQLDADPPAWEAPVADEPVVEVAAQPVADEPTWEAPADEPVVEVAAQPVADEPTWEAPADEPVVEVAAEPVADEPAAEPVADEPVADEPAVSGPSLSVVEPPAPDLSVVDAPASEEAPASFDIASPSLKELARDVAAKKASETEPVVEVEVAGPEVDVDEPMSVRSVETVSAIDLIMGGAEADEDERADRDPPAIA